MSHGNESHTDMDTKALFLGIDTSNYTTSAALCVPDAGSPFGARVIRQEKIPLPVKEGERGLRQSDAVFAHTVNLPRVLGQLFASEEARGFRGNISAVGYSARPRDAEGSYMPCFLSGEAVAVGIGASHHVPVFDFSHQSGHIAAAAYSSGCGSFSLGEFLAFHVSGGTTDVMHVVPENVGYRIELLGTSLDLHAGQLIDRMGVRLGLRFPCGIGMEKLATENTETLPSPKVCVRGCDCNLSGAENQAIRLLESGAEKSTVAAFVFRFLEKTLCGMTKAALSKYPALPVLFAGGVMSNRLMRNALSSLCDAQFAEPAFSSDNAAGIALLTARRYGNGATL